MFQIKHNLGNKKVKTGLILPMQMSALSSLLSQRRFLYLMWLVLFAFGILWTIRMPPEKAILFFNQFYNPLLVNFFKGATRIGELSGFLLALVIIIFSRRYRELFGLIAATLVMLLLVWFFKHKVYSDAIRPIVYLENIGLTLPNSSDITLNRKFSFPSGHTTASFTFFFFTGLCFQRKRIVLTLFTLAFLAGLSRVYLAQHFVVDALAGSLLGVLISTVTYLLLVVKNPWPDTFLDKKIVSSKSHG